MAEARPRPRSRRGFGGAAAPGAWEGPAAINKPRNAINYSIDAMNQPTDAIN